MANELRFKLQISIRRSEDDRPVFKKQDGERFEQPITVKLNVATKYNLLFTTRPAMDIKRVLLQGEEVALELQKRERPEDKVNVYHADWSTEAMEVTKSNSRALLAFTVELVNGMSITPKIQVKLYPEKDLSHQGGQEFHLLDINCSKKQGVNALETVEEYI